MAFLFKFLIHINASNKYGDPSIAAIKIKRLVTVFSVKTNEIPKYFSFLWHLLFVPFSSEEWIYNSLCFSFTNISGATVIQMYFSWNCEENATGSSNNACR